MKTKVVWAIALWVLSPALLLAQDEDQTIAEQIATLTTEYNETSAAWMTEYRAATTAEERRELMGSRPNPNDYAEKLGAIIEASPDDPATVDAVIWVLTYASRTPAAATAQELLVEKHYASDAIGPVLSTFTRAQPSPDTEAFLRKVIEKNPNHEIKGLAYYSLAQYLKNVQQYVGMLDDEQRGPAIRRSFGEEAVAYIESKADSDMTPNEIESLYETVVNEYGDVDAGRGTLGEVAGRELFEIQHLSVGKLAPEIEGEDVEGEVFRLSDYRGKVVMLDFWGDW